MDTPFNKRKICLTCAHASEPTDRALFWCSKKKSVTPTWDTCKEHKFKYESEEKE